MLISIRAADPRPIYLQIVDEVRRGIATGLLAADDPLPSVRQLAVNLRINPNTVAQAYRELEREGIAESRRGQGTFVVRRHVKARERRELAHEVAERALRDAYRHGMDAEQLVDAIRVVARPHLKESRA